MRLAVFLASLGMPLGCVAALAEQDVAALRLAQQADVRIYEMASPTSAAGALARSAACGIGGVLRRADAGAPLRGIVCEAPKP